MVSTQYTSNFSTKINDSFYWFKKVLFQKTRERMREFLLSDFDIKLIGISEKDNVFFVGEEYFVTRIKVDKQNEVFLRISSPLMNMILENSLGRTEGEFIPENMSELEAKILTGLNDYIFKGLSPFLVKDKAIDEETNTNLAHLTFVAKNKDNNVGKLILSIPINLLPEVRAFSPTQNFDMDSFPKYKVPVKIITGKTEIKLYDIQHIESGDIVVLEQSNIKKMIIDVYGSKKEFNINPETSIITGIDNDSEGDSMEDFNKKEGTMWDVIPVEITAEFESVTISLGELKQISEGVIVDVGSIYENKIFLKVENKPVASGELIIINDKYAVRVDEVFGEEKKEAPKNQISSQTAPKPAQKTTPQPQPQVQANSDDEEFNYDNFDIEDEDI